MGQKLENLLMSWFPPKSAKTVDDVIATFNTAVTSLNEISETATADLSGIDNEMAALIAARKSIVSEQARANRIRANLETLLA